MAMSERTWRGRAPLRLGLAGGGTDLSPYCDQYGGAVLNIAINRFAQAVIEPRRDGKVVFVAKDLGMTDEAVAERVLEPRGGLSLHRALYNRFVRDFAGGEPLSFTMTTSVDCPRGSGLGASSALMVAMIEVLRAWQGVSLTALEVAHLAYTVERRDVGMAGGRQDQYAAAVGGVNFMEFASRDRVLVNPLDLPPSFIDELESSFLLCFTGVSRFSSEIIARQVQAMRGSDGSSLEAMHQLKRDALEMKAALIHGELDRAAGIINHSWAAKKGTAPGVSNASIDALYNRALAAGALGGKISGAGGGGFMMLIVEPAIWMDVAEELRAAGGTVTSCTFAPRGSSGWAAPVSLAAAPEQAA
jgi:D-glycero-alpha-D-manno-heptose-7-phosphate kinase